MFSDEKERIAEYAASLIRKNDFVVINAGTTTEKMIKYLSERDVCFVTNAVHHAHLLADHSKFEQTAAVTFANLTDAVIITDCLQDEKYKTLTTVREVDK